MAEALIFRHINIDYSVYSWNKISFDMISQFSCQFSHIVSTMFFSSMHMNTSQIHMCYCCHLRTYVCSLHYGRSRIWTRIKKTIHSVWMNINYKYMYVCVCVYGCCYYIIMLLLGCTFFPVYTILFNHRFIFSHKQHKE